MDGFKLFNLFLNSLKVASITTAISVVLAIAAGLGFARFKFRWEFKITNDCLVCPAISFGFISYTYYTIMRNLKILNTHASLILAYISFILPFSI